MLTNLQVNLHHMKKGIFLLLIILSASTSYSQSLKDALFSGKLKNDSGSTVRKTDDLSTKIDSNRKKPVEAEKPKPTEIKTAASSNSPADTSSMQSKNSIKDNNKTWQNFVDAVVDALKAEVLNSKKIKKADYTVMVDYVIDINGQVTISNLFITPESKFLEEQIKERLSIDTPTLSPVLGGNGKPRKANKRVSFNLSKN